MCIHFGRSTVEQFQFVKEVMSYGRKHSGKADAQVAESIRKLTRVTSAMAEAIDEGVGAIKLAVKRSSDLAEEMMDDTTHRVQRHPVETMVATFGAGIIVGTLIGWMASRK